MVMEQSQVAVQEWYASLVDVIDQRRVMEDAYRVLIDRIRAARSAGARVDEIAYAAGVSTRTLHRWCQRPNAPHIYRQERTPAIVRGLVADEARRSA